MAGNKIGSVNPGARGRGRPKGAQNKMTKALKEMILEALDRAGGVDYLLEQAGDNPNAFLTLVGKVLPLQVNGAGGDGEHIVEVRRRIVGA